MPPNPLSPANSASTPASVRKRKREEDAATSRSRKQSVLSTDETYKRDMYLVFVRNALKEKTAGKTAAFDELVGRFSSDNLAESSAEAKVWILALTHVVSGLERTHSALVNSLISLPWTTMDNDFAKSYMSFIGMLVSARPEYLGAVLSQITQGFAYESLQSSVTRFSGTSTSEDPAVVVQDRLHALQQRLLELVPTLSSTLERLLVRHFPHKRQDRVAQTTYIANVLRVAEYCTGLSDRLIGLVLDRAIQIDVEIQVELDELDEEIPGPSANTPQPPTPNVEDEDDEDDDDDGLSSIYGSDSDSNETASSAKVTEMISKLDAILKLVFDHLNKTAPPLSSLPSYSSSLASSAESSSSVSGSAKRTRPTGANEGARRSQFLGLLSIFDRTVLRTFKSRYTQFIVFWYSSIDPEFTDLFLGLLVSRALFEVDQPAVTRSAAASYVASFVSRALFVDRESARHTVRLLCDFLQGQLAQADQLVVDAEGGKVNVSVSQFSVFYAVAQAVFLIFCFRWRDLLSEEDEEDDLRMGASGKWMKELDIMPKVVGSQLNPLKICSQNVVKQFAKISQATGLVYCYGIMENNKRVEWAAASLATFASKVGGGMGLPSPATPSKSGLVMIQDGASSTKEEDLNAFFPFDPYKLPLSLSYIEPIYREWSMVALDDDEDYDSEEDVDVADEEEDEEQIGRSFNEMSISPIRSLMANVTASTTTV